MLTILLVMLVLYIFWLLFRNGHVLAERESCKKRNWVGPTSNQAEWQGYCSEVFHPFSSQTTFYAIAYFANYVAAANAISWSIVSEGDHSFIVSRFGSYFALNTHDALLASGFIALACFIINWQMAVHCAEIMSQYLVRFVVISRTRFVAMSLVFCSYFAYLLTIGIFWLFHDGYSIWYGLTLTPIFLFFALFLAVVLPSMKKESVEKE
ncbi:hypothetical protein [Vibrio sp. AND4]|uniref:hypothetical protein n=1 Tax=Vibrio sp. AND4 TaxID=314289 RepID=UPI00015F318C|nr:hypothetical protein [Vibrio sp. AND4]EDP60670.1 hypothetical protein AND4_07119 [Vibrio sp. AND4]